MWSPDARRAWRGRCGLAALLVAAGCGFEPLYGRSTGVVEALAGIRIAPIADRQGQILRNHLLLRINPSGPPDEPAYLLEVVLTETREELGLRLDAVATRANLTLEARYRLTATADGRPRAEGSAGARSGYDILDSEYATLKAGDGARRRVLAALADDLTTRLALALRRKR